MAFKYALSAEQQTPTSDSKAILVKSFKIDIANGSGFLTATAYPIGWLPKDAQVIAQNTVTQTVVSGGTVSVATLALTVGGNTVFSGTNVLATGVSTGAGIGIVSTGTGSTDQVVSYTPTLTGAGATAGIIYITIFYVV
jgi:hypothetical protein